MGAAYLSSRQMMPKDKFWLLALGTCFENVALLYLCDSVFSSVNSMDKDILVSMSSTSVKMEICR